MSGESVVRIRELCGHDEQFVSDSSTSTALNLLHKLLHDLAPDFDVFALTPWDRDLLLAQVYFRTYGQQVKSSVTCKQCSEKFDLDFNLLELIDSIRPGKLPDKVESLGSGIFKTVAGRKFRLITGHDELAVIGKGETEAQKELVESCMLDDDNLSDEEIYEIQEAMAALAPIVDLDIDAKCPECHFEQVFHYNLQSYLLRAIRQEKNLLVREIHMLASSYNWGLQDILSLSRTERKSLASLIEADY